jgi:hypothetical protein
MNIKEAIQQIEIANVLWGRAQVGALLHDDQEAERLRDEYRDRLRQVLENTERA